MQRSPTHICIGKEPSAAGRDDANLDATVQSLAHRGLAGRHNTNLAAEFVIICLTKVILIPNSTFDSMSLCTAVSHIQFESVDCEYEFVQLRLLSGC